MNSQSAEFTKHNPLVNNKEKMQRIIGAKVRGPQSAKAADVNARKCQETHQPSIRKEHLDTVTLRWSDTDIVCQRAGWRGPNAGLSGRSKAVQDTYSERVPRTISPTFGASSFVTFDARLDTMSSRAISMLSIDIWPPAVGNAISRHWFEDFCTCPVLFHAHCTAAASCRALLAGNFLWSGSRFSLFHRKSAMSLIREQFASLESVCAQDIEQLIFAMMILSGHEMKARLLVEMDLPFNPHITATNVLRLWGRVEPVMALQNAAFALIRRHGGLRKLQYPGLASMAALADILRAGSYMHKPVFPCYWRAHVVDVLPESIDVEEFLTSARRPGIGFFKLPGGVPKLASSVFAEVACLDRVMSTFQDRNPTPGHDLTTLLDARAATLHRLYSLPAWHELTQEEQDTSHRAIWEVCRITTIIYCNAVILPIPPHNGWNDRYTAILIRLLTTANFEMWDVDVSELHVWVLVIGGLAAQNTAQRPFFETMLKRWYAAHRQSWSAITTTLKDFLWSDRACKIAGAMLLHHALFDSNA